MPKLQGTMAEQKSNDREETYVPRVSQRGMRMATKRLKVYLVGEDEDGCFMLQKKNERHIHRWKHLNW